MGQALARNGVPSLRAFFMRMLAAGVSRHDPDPLAALTQTSPLNVITIFSFVLNYPGDVRLRRPVGRHGL